MSINSNSCFGCHQRCGIKEVKRENVKMILKNDDDLEGLATIVSKIYGLPMACLLVVILFDHLMFPVDPIFVLSVLIIFVPSIMFVASRKIGKQLLVRGLSLE